MAVPSDLENAMSISSARIAAILNGLENKGLITRRIDSNDRRRTILRLTPAGEKETVKATERLMDLAKEIIEYLGEDDAAAYVRIMGRIADRCDNNTKQ